eukprot:CAMPEP_0114627302 /NCGR_PEP_ID=MMETSP0168-20121206/12227_1 /TAXON_ID=95228 ORGANISM="Vannella sp., Strain DIVA3 517/6/12" /NCGR_SAMPLE_ID=MMETSP0168 /ASSEMBLY_ACC=CAM_ASM_000044 /LENGTH=189 /DNA_ID=CAMNT_0001838633 /DNA_START=56 /DNA_END=622 /DNA_ORIENTATION=+
MVQYLIGPAKSGRANCSVCKAKIPKDDLRIGKASEKGDHVQTRWMHARCWKPVRTVKKVEDLVGYDELSPQQRKEAAEAFTGKATKSLFVVKPEEQARAGAYKAALQGLGMSLLKEILRLNNQPLDGRKEEVLERVIDGMLHGGIPSCPVCVYGKLWLTAEGYKCAGAYNPDTQSFKRCTFISPDITRT